jgi:cytochrome b561
VRFMLAQAWKTASLRCAIIASTMLAMSAMNAPPRYHRVAILLHWAAAALIVAAAGLALTMTGLPLSPSKLRYYAWHKWIGITIFLVTAVRLAWRAFAPPPPFPPSMPAGQALAARLVHFALYALMLAIPLSGWLYSSATGVSVSYLNLVPLPNLVAKERAVAALLLVLHQSLNVTLAVLVGIHVAAAAKHQWIDRDGVLSRMLPR